MGKGPKEYSDGLAAVWLKQQSSHVGPKVQDSGQTMTYFCQMVHKVCKGPKQYSGGFVAPWLKLCRLSRVVTEGWGGVGGNSAGSA